jgi:hypothetical protein
MQVRFQVQNLKDAFKGLAVGTARSLFITHFPKVISLIQEHGLSYHYQLQPGDSLTHNLMEFPDTKMMGISVAFEEGDFAFSNPEYASKLKVGAIIDGTFHEMFLEDGSRITASPDIIGGIDDGKKFYLVLPGDIKGKVGKLVIENVITRPPSNPDNSTDPILDNPMPSQPWGAARIDDIEFGAGLVIKDTSEFDNDQAIFFTDKGDQSSNPEGKDAFLFARTSGTEGDRHEISFTNDQSVPINLVIDVSANRFLHLQAIQGNWSMDSGDNASGVTAFTDGQTEGRYRVTIPVGGTVKLAAYAKITQDYLDTLSQDRAVLLSSSLKVRESRTQDFSGNARSVDLFYLLDMGDDAANDGVIKLPDTAENQKSVLDIDYYGTIRDADKIKARFVATPEK